jgi:hypothetical protein
MHLPSLEFATKYLEKAQATKNDLKGLKDLYKAFYKERKDSNIQPYDDNIYLTAGIGVAGAEAIRGNGDDYGVGFGLMFTGRSGVNFKIIPITNDFSKRRTALLK